MAFPVSAVLDSFDRANEGPPPSASWSSDGLDGTSTVRVESNVLKDNGSGRGGFWGSTVGPDCESYFTFSVLAANGQLVYNYVRMAQIGAVGTADGYANRFTREDSNPGFTSRFYRVDNGALTLLGISYNDTSGAISAGIKIGAEAVGSTLTMYVNKSGSWVAALDRSDSTYSSAGLIGLNLQSATPSVDDFGGGTIGAAAAVGDLGTFRTDRIRSRRTSW